MEYDFSKVMCNVFAVPENQQIVPLFPDIFFHPVFKKDPTPLRMNQVLRYIVAVFDVNGLRVRIPDVVKRRRVGLEVAKFKKNENGDYPEAVMEMMNGKNDQVNEMILHYVRMHKAPQYSYLMALEAGFYTLLAKTLSGESISNTEVKAMREMKEDIEAGVADFLNGEDAKKILEMTYKFLAEDSLGITPEDIAFNRQQGKPVVDVMPYGKDYDFSKYERDEEA